jgi:TRAP-type C4-dicarboxylate transport system permease small subunit
LSDSKSKSKLLKKVVEFLLKWLQRIFDTGAILSLIAIAIVILYQILARYALPTASVWTVELSKYLFVYSIILASGAVIIKKRHVRLETFQHYLNEKWTLIYGIFCHAVVGSFCILLLPYAWEFTSNGTQGSATLWFKMSWIFASTFIFFALVSVTSVLLIAKDLLCFFEKKED